MDWKFKMYINGVEWKGFASAPTLTQREMAMIEFRRSEHYHGGELKMIIKEQVKPSGSGSTGNRLRLIRRLYELQLSYKASKITVSPETFEYLLELAERVEYEETVHNE